MTFLQARQKWNCTLRHTQGGLKIRTMYRTSENACLLLGAYERKYEAYPVNKTFLATNDSNVKDVVKGI